MTRLAERRVGATVQASYGYNATAPGQTECAYQNLLRPQQFSLSVQVPLWQWGAHSEYGPGGEGRPRRRPRDRRTEPRAGHYAHNAALQLSQARRNLALSAKADTVAGKRFEVAYNRYVIGRITIDNLYLAQNEKDQSRVSYAQALRAYWTAYYQLRKLTLYDFETGHPIRQ